MIFDRCVFFWTKVESIAFAKQVPSLLCSKSSTILDYFSSDEHGLFLTSQSYKQCTACVLTFISKHDVVTNVYRPHIAKHSKQASHQVEL